MDGAFDDPVPVDEAPRDAAAKAARREQELAEAEELIRRDEGKRQGLAEVYEAEWAAAKEREEGEDGEGGEGKGGRHGQLEDEVRLLMGKLFHRLDALSNFAFTPRARAPEMSVRSRAQGVAAVALEEATPGIGSSAAVGAGASAMAGVGGGAGLAADTRRKGKGMGAAAASTGSAAAPEEVAAPVRGVVRSREEMSAGEKKADRRAKKRVARRKRKLDAMVQEAAGRASGGLGNPHAAASMAREEAGAAGAGGRPSKRARTTASGQQQAGGEGAGRASDAAGSLESAPSKYGSSSQFFKHMQDVARQEADQIRRKALGADGSAGMQSTGGGLRTTGRSRSRKPSKRNGGSGGTAGSFKL